jgi:hypothetical protein
VAAAAAPASSPRVAAAAAASASSPRVAAQLKTTVLQKEQAEAELQRQMKANMAYEEELQKQKQQVNRN